MTTTTGDSIREDPAARRMATTSGDTLLDGWGRLAAVDSKPRYGLEVLIVLFLGLGQSAVYSLLSIIEKLTRPNQPLSAQTTTINTSAVPDRPWLDLAYQVTYMVFPLVQVLLVLTCCTSPTSTPGG